MRALLITNPCATSTTRVRQEVITRALASALDLDTVQTRYRGHAYQVALTAGKAGYGLVLTLGGDGTVNEAVNGLVHASHGPAPGPGGVSGGSPAPALAGSAPAFAALPGGNANVFARALGLPPDPVDATGQVLQVLSSGDSKFVGLGLARNRYFCFNAGLGIDAEVVRVVEGLRAKGRAMSPALYVRAAVRQFYTVTDRRTPALTLEVPEQAEAGGLFCGIVSNTSPWTYLGDRPVRASPQATFGTGLDLFGLTKLSTFATLNAVRQMMGGGPRGKHVLGMHDLGAFTLRASRPIAFQVDGEYLGERECVTFSSVPNALRVIA